MSIAMTLASSPTNGTMPPPSPLPTRRRWKRKVGLSKRRVSFFFVSQISLLILHRTLSKAHAPPSSLIPPASPSAFAPPAPPKQSHRNREGHGPTPSRFQTPCPPTGGPKP